MPWTSDNEKIKACYGNYGFWSWLRYWYLDSADEVTMLLMDKGYYDYDYEALSAEDRAVTNAAKSDDELEARLGKMSFLSKLLRKKTPSAEEVQQAAIEQLSNEDGI